MSSDDAQQLRLRAGWAEADITPDRSASLMGYGFRAPGNDGIHAPLVARVCAFRDGADLSVIVSLDLAVLPVSAARALRQRVADETGAPQDRVLVCTTHTHSGPYAEPPYLAGVIPRVVDAARRAAALQFPVSVWVNEAPLGLAYNRRVATPDGVRNCWGTQEWPDRCPACAPDPACTVLVLRQENGPRQYLVWSLGAHPVVLGKTSRLVSPDYPGFANRMLEEYLDGARALFLLGAAGNTQPWVATQEDPRAVEGVGRCAASFVALLAQGARPVPRRAGREPACVLVTEPVGGVEIDLAAWRLGDVWLTAAPVELFSELGARIRSALGGPGIVATLANGWTGYWPTAAALAEGGYESGAAPAGLQTGAGEALADRLVALAGSLR